MSLATRFKVAAGTLGNAFASAANGLWSRIGGQGIGSRLRYLLPGARFDYEREAGDLWANSVVAICIKWIGDNFTKPPMRVSAIARNGSYRPLPRHRMVDLWQRPNPHYTGRVLSKAVALSLKSDGNAYIVKVRNGIGQPVELWWMPHWMIQPVWPSDGSAFIGGYQFIRDYQVVNLLPSEVIHFRDGLDPRNERLGLSELKAQLREICSDNEVGGYEASLLRNMGVPGVVIQPREPARLDRDTAGRLKGQFKDSLGGENRGDPIVLLNGDVEITKIGLSPAEMQLDKLPERSQARICAGMGLSPMAVGLPDPGKTYSNLAEAKSAAWNHCLVPTQEVVAEALRWQLLPEFDDPYKNIVEYDYSHINELQEDLATKAERVRKNFERNLISQNEARDELGYEPDPDGDRYYFELTAPAGAADAAGDSAAGDASLKLPNSDSEGGL